MGASDTSSATVWEIISTKPISSKCITICRVQRLKSQDRSDKERCSSNHVCASLVPQNQAYRNTMSRRVYATLDVDSWILQINCMCTGRDTHDAAVNKNPGAHLGRNAYDGRDVVAQDLDTLEYFFSQIGLLFTIPQIQPFWRRVI